MIRCRLCDYVSAKIILMRKHQYLEFSKHCLSVLNILKTKASHTSWSGVRQVKTS